MGHLHSAYCKSTARVDGKIVVVTGCNTGLGFETVKEIHKRGGIVIMACRDLEKARIALDQIKSDNDGLTSLGTLQIMHINLASLKSVRECAYKIVKNLPHVDILINNAGVVGPKQHTEDGYDLTFATNHLGPFLFTLLLMPAIKKSKAARIITISSISYIAASIHFDDLNYDKRVYSARGVYNESKLANILFTKELTKRLKDANITNVRTYCLHPGVAKTDIMRNLNMKCLYECLIFFSLIKTADQGAQTTIHCAISEEAGQETGLYYDQCRSVSTMYHANNMETAERLWQESLRMVALSGLSATRGLMEWEGEK